MTRLAEARASIAEIAEQQGSDVAAPLARLSGRALDFAFGVQRSMLEQFVFATTEMLDRTRTETHLLAEFISKMAESHSVKDVRTMWGECCQHQLDFIRRDCDRLFRHGDKMIETASNLLGNRTQT